MEKEKILNRESTSLEMQVVAKKYIYYFPDHSGGLMKVNTVANASFSVCSLICGMHMIQFA